MTHPGAAVMRPLCGFLLAAFLLTGSGHLYLGDAWSMVLTAEAVVTRGQLSIEHQPAFGGKFASDGRFFAKYGPAVAAHMLLPAALGHALEKLLPEGRVEERRILMGLPASFVNGPFSALACTMFFGIALLLGYRARVALWCTLALAFGTMVWPYAKHDAFEPQMTAALMVALYASMGGAPGGAGLACGWAMLVKPVAVLVGLPLAVYVYARRGGSAGLRAFAVGPACAVAGVLAYNFVRFGNAFETGYSAEVQGFSIPLVMGLYGLLLSAGKGVVWYSPALVLAALGSRRFSGRHPAEWALVMGTCAVHLAFYSLQQNWDGDWCWGPRYLLPCVPLFMLLALPLFEQPAGEWRTLALGIVGGLAFFVQVLGVAVNPLDHPRWMSGHKAVLGDFLRQPDKIYIPLHPHHFNPDFSPLRGHLHLLSATLAAAVGRRPAPMLIYSSLEEHSDQAGHRLEKPLELDVDPRRLGLDLWLPLMAGIARVSVPAYLAVWISFALVALALVKQRRTLWRRVRESEAP